MSLRTQKPARARLAAVLAASALSVGAVGLLAPAASAATTAGGRTAAPGPSGGDVCEAGPHRGGFHCTVFGVSSAAKPALDSALPAVDSLCHEPGPTGSALCRQKPQETHKTHKTQQAEQPVGTN